MLSRVFIGSVYNLTRNTNANGERVNGVLDDTAVCKGPQCVACARTALVQPLRLLGPVTVETEPASMIRACRCLPRLAGRQRTTGGIRNSAEGLGAGGAGGASRSGMLQCLGSRCRERQRNRFYTALVACA